MFAPYIAGLVGWWLTGVDDLLIFANVYATAHDSRGKIGAITGLLTGIACMVLLVFLVGQGASRLFGKWIWLGGLLPAYVATMTIINRQTEIKYKPHTIFILAFLGFALHCTDDIVYNTAMIMGKSIPSQLAYLGGVVSGSIAMIIIAIRTHHHIRDWPRVRAGVLYLVSLWILWPGIRQLLLPLTN